MTLKGDLRATYDVVTTEAARAALTEFVVERAHKIAANVGFGWIAVEDAPGEFTALQRAVARSRATGQPLPISAENSDDVIYLSAEANTAYRFWHDVSHVDRALSFDLVDELELALWHLGELEAEGFAPSSLPWRLLHADLVGQVQLMALAQRFPVNQRHFVMGSLTEGFEPGLISEARRVMTPGQVVEVDGGSSAR